MAAYLVSVAVAACAPARSAGPRAERQAQEVIADLDADGHTERVTLSTGTTGPDRYAVTVSRGPVRIASGVLREWKPWRLRVADVDGDGRREIAVGIWKATRYFPRPHNCLFIYRLDGSRLAPKWLGSSLARPFEDFAFANLDGDAAVELVAVERLADGRRCATVYSWSGFGFRADRVRGAWRGVRIESAGARSVVLVADGRRVVLGGPKQ